MRALSQAWHSIERHAARQGRLFLCFDFDGTLAPFVPSPSRAVVPPGGRRLLRALARRPRFRVAVVSSRGLRDLERRVLLGDIALAGSNGLEIRVGRNTIRPPVPTELDAEVVEKVRRLVERHPPARLEVKPAGLAVHVRGVTSRARAVIGRRLVGSRTVAQRRRRAWRWLRCRETFDYLPTGAGKHLALRLFARLWQFRPGDLWIYAGDDFNDVEALQEVRSHGGLALGVGPSPPPASQYHVRDTVELLSFIEAVGARFAAAPTGNP